MLKEYHEQNGCRRIAEVCCGSYYDAAQAAAGGASRIELNSALMLGGLTPTTATLRLVKEHFPQLKVITMVRPRGSGFCYTEEEFLVMEEECRDLLKCGADGVAFGCLKPDAAPDPERNRRLISWIKKAGKEAVFHRAFDCCKDPYATMEQLIDLGIDRVLTSGLKPKAMEGAGLLAELQKCYGDQIQILAGSGVNAGNACKLMERTGICQVHSSCRAWLTDPTTVQNGVSYSIAAGVQELQYDVVSAELVRELVQAVEMVRNRR